MDGVSETAEFSAIWNKMFKILNVKSPVSHIHLNDPDRAPFTSVNDPRFDFLKKVVKSLEVIYVNKLKNEE